MLFSFRILCLARISFDGERLIGFRQGFSRRLCRDVTSSPGTLCRSSGAGRNITTETNWHAADLRYRALAER
jgi:hypothetical protein